MMITFIAKQIEKSGNKSVAQGQAKYRAYFINTKIYEDLKDDVDSILEIDGFEFCIVNE